MSNIQKLAESLQTTQVELDQAERLVDAYVDGVFSSLAEKQASFDTEVAVLSDILLCAEPELEGQVKSAKDWSNPLLAHQRPAYEPPPPPVNLKDVQVPQADPMAVLGNNNEPGAVSSPAYNPDTNLGPIAFKSRGTQVDLPAEARPPPAQLRPVRYTPDGKILTDHVGATHAQGVQAVDHVKALGDAVIQAGRDAGPGPAVDAARAATNEVQAASAAGRSDLSLKDKATNWWDNGGRDSVKSAPWEAQAWAAPKLRQVQEFLARNNGGMGQSIGGGAVIGGLGGLLASGLSRNKDRRKHWFRNALLSALAGGGLGYLLNQHAPGAGQRVAQGAKGLYDKATAGAGAGAAPPPDAPK